MGACPVAIAHLVTNTRVLSGVRLVIQLRAWVIEHEPDELGHTNWTGFITPRMDRPSA
jgi:hypothetical protein